MGELEKAVGVVEGGLQAAGGFAAKGEIGQRHPALDAGPLRFVPASPDLGVNHRRFGEGEVIEPLLLSRLQQRAQDPHIQRAGDAEVEVLGAVICFMHGFEPSFGPQ